MIFSEAEAALYRELWHACAGPLVTVPREGELVFYFPQGHIEQVTLINYLFFDTNSRFCLRFISYSEFRCVTLNSFLWLLIMRHLGFSFNLLLLLLL